MPRKSIVVLSSDERAALETGYKTSKSAIYSRRCHIILLKSEGLPSKQIASFLGITDQAVNNWVKRYRSDGLNGLNTKPGQGRKPILNKEQDAEKVRLAVQQERQRLKVAKDLLSQELNKDFSLLTLKRFLKHLTADGSEFH